MYLKLKIICFFALFSLQFANSYRYDNVSTPEPANVQLLEFKLRNPVPDKLTTTTGVPVDHLRLITLNTDLAASEHFLENIMQLDAEKIPERVVHAKGTGAFGYFEVTSDVSKYIRADLFNGIGKRTPLFTRLSLNVQSSGGNDLVRENRGFGTKFYTKAGNLDILWLQIPVFNSIDPIEFPNVLHALKKNPKTNLVDRNSAWDFITNKPVVLQQFLWMQSDYGIPDGYRKMDVFALHTFEITNNRGERHYARFNFRTEQGLANLTSAEAATITATDLDYFTRDLYNSIQSKDYPSWRLDMDVMTLDEILDVDYDAFDITRMWKRGTYRTVTIGRMVLNKNPENQFRDVEQSIFFPGNLVPGIEGPVDISYKGRLISYRDAQNYRLGVNHNKIKVNLPLKHVKTYIRDGLAPVGDNMRDVPNYYPNSFNGPQPIIDINTPKSRLKILHSNAVDLGLSARFYNNILKYEGPKQRLADNIVASFMGVLPRVREKAVRLLSLIDCDLVRRVKRGLFKPNLLSSDDSTHTLNLA